MSSLDDVAALVQNETLELVELWHDPSPGEEEATIGTTINGTASWFHGATFSPDAADKLLAAVRTER